MSLFDEAQPLFVETSEKALLEPTLIPARDFLYKSLTSSYLHVQAQLSAEKIESAYVELFRYHPAMQMFTSEVISALKKEDEKLFGDLLNDTKYEVMKIKPPLEYTAELGNALRAVAGDRQAYYLQETKKILDPAEKFLSSLVLKSDDDLLIQENLKSP